MWPYIRVVAERLEVLGAQLAREAAEGVVEDVIGLLGKGADGLIDGGNGHGVLELDDVLAVDELVGATGRQEGSRLLALHGRGGQDSGEDGEKDGQLHREGMCGRQVEISRWGNNEDV